MGQDSRMVLINNTPYDWTRSNMHSYQMHGWEFPEKINAYTSVGIYIEWDENIFHHSKDDAGDVTYSFDERKDSSGNDIKELFSIKCSNGSEKNTKINISKITRAVASNKTDSLSLEWRQDSVMNFGITGDRDGYQVMGDNFSNWMADSLSVFGNRKLKNMTLLGSHDAGMSESGASTVGATAYNTVTQTKDIEGQLHLGARYFDIRPVISGGQFYTGHYNLSPDAGANGQILSSIISQFNEFLNNRNELVIIRISHAYNTDVGYGNYRELNADEWNRLLDQLEGIRSKHSDTSTSLLDCTMSEFIKDSSKVIILLGADDCGSEYKTIKEVLSVRARSGFFLKEKLNVYDHYSDTDKYADMKSDQLSKLNKSSNHSSKLFLLSWTLTQKGIGVVVGASILTLAEEADAKLCEDLYNDMKSNKEYPNIVYLDKIDTTEGIFIAMATNHLNKVT